MTFVRLSDRWKKPTTIAGFFVLLVWAVCELALPPARRPSDAVTHVMLVLGAGLISPSFVVDVVRAWRGSNGAAAAPPSSPPAATVVVPSSEGEVDG